jgi:hypothetical protein
MVFYRFVKHPEYLKTGQRLVFREGRTKAVGSVTKIIPHVSTVGQEKGQNKSGHHKNIKPQQQQQQQQGGSRGGTSRTTASESAAPSTQ